MLSLRVLGQGKTDTNHVLREISNHNNTIHGLEIEGGWIEMNTFQTYKDVCEMLFY